MLDLMTTFYGRFGLDLDTAHSHDLPFNIAFVLGLHTLNSFFINTKHFRSPSMFFLFLFVYLGTHRQFLITV